MTTTDRPYHIRMGSVARTEVREGTYAVAMSPVTMAS